MKTVLRLCGIFLTFIVIVFAFQILENEQKNAPFCSELSFEMEAVNLKTNKAQMVSELNAIVTSHHGEMYKEVVDDFDLVHKRNIIWFGEEKPKSNNIFVYQDEIKWLTNSLTGRLIHSDEMGETPLSGEYFISRNLQNDLSLWAKKNNIHLSFREQPSQIKQVYQSLIDSPIGNVIIATYLLIMMSFLTYFLLCAKKRTLKLLSGVRRQEIIKYDVDFLLKQFFIGVFVAIVAIAGYHFGVRNSYNAFLILKLTIRLLFVVSVFIGLSGVLMAIFIRPRVYHIADRSIPLKKFNYLVMGLKILATMLVISILANTFFSMLTIHTMEREYEYWEEMGNVFRLSFNSSLDDLNQEENLKVVQDFLENMQSDDNLSLSLVIDRSIRIENELKLAGFDHFIMVDKSWLNFVGVGIEERAINGKLEKYELKNLEPTFKTFIMSQMPLLFYEPNAEKLNYYTFSGKTLCALAANTGNIDALVFAKNPLVVVVNSPNKDLKLESCVIPTLSSGNIIFSNKDRLYACLNQSSLKNNVISVDGIADLVLKIVQDFRLSLMSYAMASFVLLLTILFLGILSAKLWVYKNRKTIYIMVTNGKTFLHVIQGAIISDVFVMMQFVLLASIFTYFLRIPVLLPIIAVMMFVMVLYSLGVIFAYRFFTKREFKRVIDRN